MIAWLMDRQRGAARLMGVACAAAGFVAAAHFAQVRIATGFRHSGLIFAAYSVVLLITGVGAALAAPPVIRLWAGLLRILGSPSPAAALVVVAAVAGGVTAWSLIGDGPAVVGVLGGAVSLLGVAAAISLRRR